MHLTPECTALSIATISGIKELGVNVMVLCNKCVENNERDNFIRGRAERKKRRTLLVTMPNEHEARLTLAKIHEHREMLKKKECLYYLL